MKQNPIIVTIFNDPENYPPTLNAVTELAGYFEKVILVSRHFNVSGWDYPPNVSRININPLVPMEEMYRQSTLRKFFTFFKYLSVLRKTIVKNRPALVLCYDPIAALAFWLVRFTLLKNPKFWYHNHDVLDFKRCRKFSIQWWAGYMEPKVLKEVDLFSLPSREREKYFNLKALKGKYLFLPNFPHPGFYSGFQRPDFYPADEIRIIYQGSISKGHGIEEVIQLLDQEVNGKKLHLTLIGFLKTKYKNKLLKLASDHKVSERFTIKDPVKYNELPLETASHHIGSAIHLPENVMYSTGATASNKIYEYIALGLPVLLYDSEHYRKHLERHKWAFFTDLSRESLIHAISEIDKNYPALKKNALTSFSENLNFEASFKKAILHLKPEEPVQSN